jgi:hypothetical protein
VLGNGPLGQPGGWVTGHPGFRFPFSFTDLAGKTHRLPDYRGIDRTGRVVGRELGSRDWGVGEARAKLEALVK